MSLAEEHAVRIDAHTPSLTEDEARELAKEIPQWALKDKLIVRLFEFEDFDQAMDFVNKVADIARREDHHPEICINYRKVLLQFSTHRIGGLSRNDFVVAALVDRLMGE